MKSIIIAIACLATAVNGITINCMFTSGNVDYIVGTYADYYQCWGSIIDSSNPGVLDEITGAHLDGKSNRDVQAIMTTGVPLGNFFQNLNQFFPNLEMIYFMNAGIKTISRSNLTPFSNLRFLFLSRNEIVTLQSDLFFDLPVVRTIDLSFNQIRHVGPNLIYDRPRLAIADFRSNPCIDIASSGTSRAGVVAVNDALNRNCPM
jgi:hypothetical protein